MRAKLLSAVGAIIACAVSAFGAGATPISNLKLVGDANGASANFTNLNNVVASTAQVEIVQFRTGTNMATMTQADVASMQGTLPDDQLRELHAKAPTPGSPDSAVATKGWLGDTTLGSEGFRQIGALGGYTLEEFTEDTAHRGLARDLPEFIYASTNLTVSYSSGDVYEPTLGYFHLDPGSRVLTDNAVNHAYWSTNDVTLVQWTTGTRPQAAGNIWMGSFTVAFGEIKQVSLGIAVGDELLEEDVAFANIMPSIITDGLTVFASGTNLDAVVLNSGIEYHNMAERLEHDSYSLATSSNLLVYGHSGGTWVESTTNQMPIGVWDDGSNIVACVTTNWYRGVFVSFVESGRLGWIMPDVEYMDETEALAGSDPDLPPGFTPYIPLTSAYVFQGSDTSLRTDSTYWIDRRFMIRRGYSTVAGGGSSSTPTLQQVLLAGAGTGGILPSGMGDPVTDDQASSKGYVDSTRNKASTGTAYVDPVNGDDVTARIQKASLPFKTIQAAIDACAVVASDSNRFLVSCSIGTYIENVSMKPYISLRGMDIESTIIEGQITWPSAYVDVTGVELQIITVRMTNAPAVVISLGSDDSYVGLRSCALYSTYTVDAANKSVVKISRGNIEIYATTWVELAVSDVAAKRPASLYHLATDGANVGSYHVNSFSSSHVMRIADTNDTVMIAFCNSTQGGFFASKGDATLIFLDDGPDHANNVTSVAHKQASARSFVESSIIDVRLAVTNACDIVAVSSTGSVSTAVAHFNNSRLIVPNVNVGQLYYGSAATADDCVEIINSQIGTISGAYPERYTEVGAAGRITYVLQHSTGDMLLGGGIDLSADNPSGIVPVSGHGLLSVQTTSGFENPYFLDSSGVALRNFRDSSRTMYNAELTTLVKGEAVYVPLGISGTANYCKRAKADSLTTMPCVGIVASMSIAAGAKGRIFWDGRVETGVDTHYMTAGQPVYLSADVGGGFTNVAPASGYVQRIGYANVIGANGSILISIGSPDILGDQPPSAYAFQSDLTSETNRAQVAEASLQSQIITNVDPALTQGRLTLDSATPVTISDQTNKTTLYFVPYNGNRIALYVASTWTTYSFTSTSVALGALTTGKNYDVFAYYSSGVKIEVLVWTSDVLRETALTTQDGIYVKNGALDRKYLGTIRINSAGATCEDSAARRFVWNHYNRMSAQLRRVSDTDSWTYSTATWRQANAAAANLFEFVTGLQEESVEVWGVSTIRCGGNGRWANIGIGVNSTTAPTGERSGAGNLNNIGGTLHTTASFVPQLGYNYIAWLEYATASCTFYGTSTTPGSVVSGIGMKWTH